MKIFLFYFFQYVFLFSTNIFAQDSLIADDYLNAMKQKGNDPLQFILDVLDTHDLILFDDANHSAVEPFEFYQMLISNDKFQDKVRFIFIEAFALNMQPYLDTYLDSSNEDRTLLYPAFQNDYSGIGWRYNTYFDLLHTIYTVNKKLPPEGRFKVIAVSNPVFWTEVRTTSDLKLFRESLISFDYTMYKVILKSLDYFKSGEKGIFLTNTRHSYKGIKNNSGTLYWNCGTFFAEWNPGKTYSVRFHNAALYLEQARFDADAPKTTEGLETVKYKWIPIAGGLWDSAFALYGYKPVAMDIKDTPFGRESYVGNLMLDVFPGQTMYDAYDAVIFLVPLGKLHQSALVGEIYTPGFRLELERRLVILYTPEQLQSNLKSDSASTIQEYIEKEFRYEPETLLPAAQKAMENK